MGWPTLTPDADTYTPSKANRRPHPLPGATVPIEVFVNVVLINVYAHGANPWPLLLVEFLKVVEVVTVA